MAKKICSFCLEEGKGLFNHPEELSDGHYICKNCRKIITHYDLPVRYDLFQILVTSEPDMHEMIMHDYLEQHSGEESIAKFYPLPKVLLHDGEHCINEWEASINVPASLIPSSTAPSRIVDIVSKDMITNLKDAGEQEQSTTVTGMLYETEIALYFLSPHFINCHKPSNIVREGNDDHAIHVLERAGSYTYTVKHADLFFLREQFYEMASAALADKQNGLIYLTSENTMTITPGIYTIPRNLRAGTYWVSPVQDDGITVRDAAGRTKAVHPGRIKLYEGSTLEVTGSYEFRIHPKEENESN